MGDNYQSSCKQRLDRGARRTSPNQACTDRGRAINQQERGWETTLTGLPKELFEFWQKFLQPRGYKIRYQIVNFPNGMPGDIGITLSWS